MYEGLRTFEVLGIEKKPDVRTSACSSVAETLRSTSSASEDLFNALRINAILKCELNEEAFVEIASRFNDNLNGAKSLIDFYYSIGSLVLVKDQTSNRDVHLRDADKIFRSLKDLSQSDGRWRYNSNNPESSADAAGIALETLAGVISLASSEIDGSLVANLKNDIVKLFDSIERYAWADAFIVTADSVSMLSEACSTGKPVYVIGAERCTWKFVEFNKKLRERGMVRPFTGLEDISESWSYPPLNDTADAANQVIHSCGWMLFLC